VQWSAAEPLHEAHGVPQFIDQITKTLLMEQSSDPIRSRQISGPAGGGRSATSEIGSTARLHARELFRQGYTVNRLVHDYGDVCQSITDLALESAVSISVDEFRTLNRCLDNAIAESVTEYSGRRDQVVAELAADASHERMGAFAHELRNLLATASHALKAIRTGQVGLSGSTAAVLDRSLDSLHTLVDRALEGVRSAVLPPVPKELIRVADLIADVSASAALEAQSRGCYLTIVPVQPDLAVHVDRETLFAALNNLLQNAFKFTRYGSQVSLHAYASAERVQIDVEDNCGGLPRGDPEHLFLPFTQSGEDRSGVGVGLFVCRRHVEANHGRVNVRDIPGAGCVFTIDFAIHWLKAPEGCLPSRVYACLPKLLPASGVRGAPECTAATYWTVQHGNRSDSR
jgi:signal transduction histidine kinase